jgi:hypothetical protein
MHSSAASAYTLAYPAVLTIVHLNGTSILFLYTIYNISYFNSKTVSKDYIINLHILQLYKISAPFWGVV